MRCSILATIAKQERIRISEPVHAGLARARKQGRVVGRPRLVLSHGDEPGRLHGPREIMDHSIRPFGLT